MTKETRNTLFVYVSAGIVSIGFALYNGFPLVYSDTGTYIVSGCSFYVPFDRPIFYGLFLLATSLRLSLWLTIIAQALLSVFLIRKLLIYLTGTERNINSITLLSVTLLTLVSSYSYTVSELIPDIFTALLLLCILLWHHNQLMKRERWFIALIFCFSLTTHNSHFLIAFVVLPILFLSGVIMRIGITKRVGQLVMLSILALIVNLSFNFFNHKGFRLSRVSNAFIFARMLQTGAVHRYVEHHPESNDLIAKNIRETPYGSARFLWNTDSSVLYFGDCMAKGGFEACWLEKDSLLGSYISKVMRHGPSRDLYMDSITYGFVKQNLFYRVEMIAPMLSDYPVKVNVEHYFKLDFPMYMNAAQNKEVQHFLTTNRILPFSSIIAVLIIIGAALVLKSMNYRFAVLSFVLFYVVNAFVCTTFSSTTERYTTRISWVYILLAVIGLINLFIKVMRQPVRIR
jgi:hypothetical protein